jgi:hypothetical protein
VLILQPEEEETEGHSSKRNGGTFSRREDSCTIKNKLTTLQKTLNHWKIQYSFYSDIN